MEPLCQDTWTLLNGGVEWGGVGWSGVEYGGVVYVYAQFSVRACVYVYRRLNIA